MNQLNTVNSQIIAAGLQLVQDDRATVFAQLFLPFRSAITRTLNRCKQTSSRPTIATDDRYFEIPDRSKHFCLCDSWKQDTERILIFGDIKNLSAVKLYNRIWLVDVTFKIYPSQFYQLYTLNIWIGGFYSPCVYAQLGNKSLSNYNKFLTALKLLVSDVKPERNLIVFEVAAVNRFASDYKTDIKGCYFPLCQSFMRKLSDLGLEKNYESNSEQNFALNVIPALSFLPESKVKIWFLLVKEEIGSVASKTDNSQNDLEKLD